MELTRVLFLAVPRRLCPGRERRRGDLLRIGHDRGLPGIPPGKDSPAVCFVSAHCLQGVSIPRIVHKDFHTPTLSGARAWRVAGQCPGCPAGQPSGISPGVMGLGSSSQPHLGPDSSFPDKVHRGVWPMAQGQQAASACSLGRERGLRRNPKPKHKSHPSEYASTGAHRVSTGEGSRCEPQTRNCGLQGTGPLPEGRTA